MSKFMYETLAYGGANLLPVSSVCNARCIFCSNDMNPFTIHRAGFRCLEDVRKGVALLDPRAGEIRIGDSLPGRISEGEAFLHPDILRILALIRKKAPRAVIQVSTNGTMLTRDFVESLVPYKPLKCTISYHSNTERHWRTIFNLGKGKFEIARDSFVHCARAGFIIEGALVPLPRLVGYSDIENTLRYLRAFSRNVIINAPGYSVMAAPSLKKILKIDLEELSRFLAKMRVKYRMDLMFMIDPRAPLDFYPDRIMRETNTSGFREVAWFFSEAAYGRASKILKKHACAVSNRHYAHMVKNRTYGGNIICSGLLMVSDYRRAIREALKACKKNCVGLVVLPANSFDRFGDDLRGESYFALSREFGLPVWAR